MRKYLLAVGFLGTAVLATAQDAVEEAAGAIGEGVLVTTAPQFFVAIIAGLVLAAGFQLVLTNLSLAAGLNMIGKAVSPEGTDKESSKEKGEGRSRSRKDVQEKVHETLDSAQESVRKVTSAFGFWTLLTVSISVFFAAWLAVLLSGTFNLLLGALMGLVIWGLSLVVMTILETSALSSLLGSLVDTARSGLRSARETITGLFTRSPEKKAADTAKDIASTVREEILGGETIKDQLKDYLGKIEHQFSPKKIRQELEKLLDNTELEYIYKEGDPWQEEDRVIASLHSGGGMKAEQARSAVKSIKDAIRIMREERAQGKSRPEAVAETAMRAAGMGPAEAEHTRQKIEEYLRNTGKEELNPEGIKRDLERLVSEPRQGVQSLKERLGHIDRSTVTAVLAQRQDMSEAEATRLVDRFMGIVQEITGIAESQARTAEQRVGEQPAGLKERVESKLRDYLNSLGKPELGYEGIKEDVQKMLHDPKAGGKALIERLKSIDRDTIKTMLTKREDIDEEDAERIISRVEEARDEVVERVERIEQEVSRRVKQARWEAQHQAEEAAHTASTAAWWAFFTAIVSAGAAVLGGMMPVL